jgi:hypothetical protein
VVYFSDETQQWSVKDFQGLVCGLNMPIHERDCFVYFDESRCRGSDMKLLPRASALLTLGLKMCKDKAMQAAGRMRLFGSGQTVTLVAADDVVQQIITLNELTPAIAITTNHALLWVLHNTIEATKTGMLERAYQGMYFCTTNNDCSLVTLDEKSQLVDYYSEPQTMQSMQAAHALLRAFFTERAGFVLSPNMQLLLESVDAFADEFGSDVHITGSTNEEEAEKQLEKEVEKEVEREVQRPCEHPKDEIDWNYTLACAGRLPQDISTLQHVVETHTHSDLNLKDIDWSGDCCVRICCTSNFVNTVQSRGGPAPHFMEEYLRTVDVCLYFSETDMVLLVSEREADAILAHLHSIGFRCSMRLVHLSDLRRAYNKSPIVAPTLSVPLPIAFLLMLFNGDTTFPSDSQSGVALLKALKGNRAAQVAAKKIPALRGKAHMLSMSDIDTVCKELA